MTKSNDNAEIVGYFESLKEIVDDILKIDTYAKNAEISLADRIKKTIDEKLNYLMCLAMCFSSANDDLSQWVMYGDNGKGVAIKFNRDIVLMITNQRNGHPLISLGKMNYYDKTTIRLPIEKRLNTLRNRYSKCQTSNDRQRIVSEWVGTIIQEDAPFYKKRDFENEKEIRLCYTRFVFPEQLKSIAKDSILNNLCFRTTGSEIVPYIEYNIEPYHRIIDEVIIGPCNSADRMTIEYALKFNGFEVPIVQRSSVPYRLR